MGLKWPVCPGIYKTSIAVLHGRTGSTIVQCVKWFLVLCLTVVIANQMDATLPSTAFANGKAGGGDRQFIL